jgi:hypothetical protein
MVQQVEQLSTSYPQEWDDRVFCHECKHCSAVAQRKSMPAELMEKIRKKPRLKNKYLEKFFGETII